MSGIPLIPILYPTYLVENRSSWQVELDQSRQQCEHPRQHGEVKGYEGVVHERDAFPDAYEHELGRGNEEKEEHDCVAQCKFQDVIDIAQCAWQRAYPKSGQVDCAHGHDEEEALK